MSYANLLLNVLYHIVMEMKIRESCLQTGTFIYKPGISVTKQDFHLQMGSLGLQMGFSGYYLPAGMEKSVLYDMQQELFWINQYVNMALQYQRMNSGMNDLVLEMVSADQVVRTAIRRFALIMIRKKIAIHYEECREMVLSDEKWLEFVVEQILSNAIKYSGENHAITIQINRNEADNTCELVISDQGIGIRKEDLPRIFEKGYTGYNGRADKTSTGIGLYLCREITKKLGHGIMITSEIGKGTDVTIVFERNNLDVRD